MSALTQATEKNQPRGVQIISYFLHLPSICCILVKRSTQTGTSQWLHRLWSRFFVATRRKHIIRLIPRGEIKKEQCQISNRRQCCSINQEKSTIKCLIGAKVPRKHTPVEGLLKKPQSALWHTTSLSRHGAKCSSCLQRWAVHEGKRRGESAEVAVCMSSGLLLFRRRRLPLWPDEQATRS